MKRERRRKEEEEEGMETMVLYGNYGFVWNCYMDDYVFGMEIV